MSSIDNEQLFLLQNPQNPAPKDILDNIRIIDVEYYGFDTNVYQGKIAMHKDVSKDIREFFELALKLKFPIESVTLISDPKYKWDDEISCNDNNSSGFNYRSVSGNSTKLSKHATGLAFDINPVQNIYVRYDKDLKEIFRAPTDGVYDKNEPGTLFAGDPLVTFMKNLGWNWGGDWRPESGREDYQHFEKSI